MIVLFFYVFFQFQFIEKDFASLQSFRADFEQVYSYTGSKEKIKERGFVYFKKPSLFRWEYTYPERKIFILNGKEILTYIPDEKIVQRERLEDEMMDIISILTEGRVSKVFEIKEKDCGENHCAFLYPKERREFNWIEIRYSKKELKEIVIKFDYSENRIIFKKIQKNIKIPQKIFPLDMEGLKGSDNFMKNRN